MGDVILVVSSESLGQLRDLGIFSCFHEEWPKCGCHPDKELKAKMIKKHHGWMIVPAYGDGHPVRFIDFWNRHIAGMVRDETIGVMDNLIRLVYNRRGPQWEDSGVAEYGEEENEDEGEIDYGIDDYAEAD